MLDALRGFWDSFNQWMKQEPFIASLIGGLLLLIVALILKLPWRLAKWIRSRKKKPIISEDFPFERIKPEEFGQWLLDKRWLTCCDNPFVPKKEIVISSPDPPVPIHRRIFFGAAEIGKTRAAYEWIREVLRNAPNTEILIPAASGLPYPVKEENISPPLAETVVLFCDDMNKFLRPAGRAQLEREDRILSAEDRFGDLIELLEAKSNLYIVATARWESQDEVRSIESGGGIWRTFQIVTLEDAPPASESNMITQLAGELEVELEDGVEEKMADINKGHSYENTVVFLQNWRERENRPLSLNNLRDYARNASDFWEKQTFKSLCSQNKLLPQIIGAMYTLRFDLRLPLYERFVLRAAAILTRGRFRKRRLRRALELLCSRRGGFRRDGDMISCHDFQLGVSERVSLSPQDCLKGLCRLRWILAPSQRSALADWYLYEGLRLYNQNALEGAAEAWRRSVLMKKDYYEAYYSWGLALHELAHLRQDEALYQESFHKYEKAVEFREDSHEAYSSWGVALSELAHLRQDEALYQESFRKYEKAVEFKEDYYEAYYNWGTALAALARMRQDEALYQESFRKYEKAVEFKEDYHEAYYNWGNALVELARMRQDEALFERNCQLLEDSFRKYEKAVEFREDFHQAYNNWGAALYELAHLRHDEALFQESIEKLRRAVKISPDFWSAHFNLACCYALQHLTEEACEWLDSSILLHPEVASLVRTDSDFNPIRDTPVFQEWCQNHPANKQT